MSGVVLLVYGYKHVYKACAALHAWVDCTLQAAFVAPELRTGAKATRGGLILAIPVRNL